MISASFPSLLQSFFTDRLLRQRQASPHTIAGYRDCFRLLLHFAKERLSKMPSKLRIEDLVLLHWSLPRSLGKHCGKTALAPGISAWGRFTLSSSTWLSRSRRMRCIASESWRCPTNATNDGRSSFSIGKRSTRCSRCRLFHLDRAPRSDPAAGHRPDRSTGFRVDWPELPGCLLGNGCPCPLPGERQKTSMHASPSGNGKDAGSLATGTPWPAGRSALSQHPRRKAQPRCSRASGQEIHPIVRNATCPSLKRKNVSPHALSTFRSHGPSPKWGRPYRDCSLAGTRICGDNSDLSACRHEVEGESALAHPASRRQTRTIPARRPTAGLPGEPLIMPSLNTTRARSQPLFPERSRHNRGVGMLFPMPCAA